LTRCGLQKTIKKKDKKKEKKEKDPNAPKRPKSAYMQFVRHRLSPAMPRSSPDIDANVLRNIQAIVRRPQVVNENPGIAFGAVGKLLGEEWRAMTDVGKKQYQDMADADKEVYNTAKAEYDAKQN
jgi:hypothetical protein